MSEFPTGFAWRETPRSRVLALAAVIVGSMWLALANEVHVRTPRVEPAISPLPGPPDDCRARGSVALEHARTLEQVAAAHWERAPFALREAPRAVAQIAEAEACFAAANDNAGRARAAATRRAYAAELERRFERARLLLHAALRRSAGRARDARTSGGAPLPLPPSTAPHELAAVVRRQLVTLLALLDRAPPSARPYRDELEQLARHYAAESPLISANEGESSVTPEHSRGRAAHLSSALEPASTP